MPETMDEVARLIGRYPGPLMLRASRRKWLLVGLGCAVFTAIGVVLQINEPSIMALLTIGFFGLGVLVAGAVLLPGSAALTLDTAGFEVIHFFRPRRTRWQDAEGFQAVSIPPSGIKRVAYDDKTIAAGGMAAASAAITGRNAALPDNYGLGAEELAALMQRWRAQALH